METATTRCPKATAGPGRKGFEVVQPLAAGPAANSQRRERGYWARQGERRARKSGSQTPRKRRRFDENNRMIAEYRAAASEKEKAGWEAALMEANSGLVYTWAHRYWHPGLHMSFEDLVSEGNFGLLIAIRRFKPELKWAFSTYAMCVIRSKIRRAVVEQGGIMRLSAHMVGKIGTVKRAEDRIRARDGRERAESGELAEEAEISPGELEKRRAAELLKGVVSLDAPLQKRPTAESDVTTRGELVPAEGDGPEEAHLRESALKIVRGIIRHNAGDELSERVLLMRTGGETLKAIGNDVGMSYQGVRDNLLRHIHRGSVGRALREAGIDPAAVFGLRPGMRSKGGQGGPETDGGMEGFFERLRETPGTSISWEDKTREGRRAGWIEETLSRGLMTDGPEEEF